MNLPSGCVFHARCPQAMDRCYQEKPKLKEYGNRHYVACHLMDKRV
ncbi:oligopeptide/dipeptide ABC transporter ATP-binding protein [Pelistega indica]|nr:oligopeptide/dipeptide ABC transporter ATP-binding protein [Pelistega indica]